MNVAQLLAEGSDDSVVLTDADWNHWPDGWSDGQTWEFAAQVGLRGIEVGVYDVATELAPARREERLRLAERFGVPVSALLLSLPRARWPRGALTATGDELAQLLVQVTGCARVCRDLGLPVLGLWPGADVVAGAVAGHASASGADGADGAAGGAGVDGAAAATGADRAWREAIEGLSRARDAADASGVRLAVEYKPGTVVATAAEALSLAGAVPGTGVLLDTGHAWAAGEDPAQSVRQLRDAGVLWAMHLGDAHTGGSDDDLPLGRAHPVEALLSELRRGFAAPGRAAGGEAGAGPVRRGSGAGHVTATFDLYGAVEGGHCTGDGAVRESLAALEAALQ